MEEWEGRKRRGRLFLKAYLASRPHLSTRRRGWVFNLYFCTKVLILTEAVVSLADLYRPW